DDVDALPVEVDGERNERAVAFEDLLDLPILRELRAVVLELDDDLGAAALALALLDLVAAGAIAGPDMAGLGGAPGVRIDLHAFRDHERGIKADAKLADEAGVLRLALAQGLEEGLRAGVGDGAEVLDQLGARHAEAEILEGDGLGLVVG